MGSLRAMIIDSNSFQQRLLNEMLQHLGVESILLAHDCEDAAQVMVNADNVDIIFCNVKQQGFELLEFLYLVRKSGWAKAVAVLIDYPADLKRNIANLKTLSTLELLGVLSNPLKTSAVEALLNRYLQRCGTALPVITTQPVKMPSEIDVRRGLSAGEFKPWYQPKLNMLQGAIVGVEALVRWYHPDRGILLPKDFLTALLAYNLIDEVFKIILSEGISLLKKMRDYGVEIEIAFNLHASQLARRELVIHIKKTLVNEGVPGAALLFELSENGLLQLSLDTQVNMMRLRMLGCTLAVDNFGSGFSSFELLSWLPFNQLKLEGGAVRSLISSHQHAMVASAQALARALNMSFVVEGVSSQAIYDALLDMGCVVGQGYYLAPPMSERQLLAWVFDTQSTEVESTHQEEKYR